MLARTWTFTAGHQSLHSGWFRTDRHRTRCQAYVTCEHPSPAGCIGNRGAHPSLYLSCAQADARVARRTLRAIATKIKHREAIAAAKTGRPPDVAPVAAGARGPARPPRRPS
jgi:hypothetical protein